MRPLLSLLALATATPAALLAADSAMPAEASQAAFVRAVVDAPALTAATRRASAARARVDAAGRLPNPEVEGMASRMNGGMEERATTWEVTFRQPLPKRGERAAERERARAGIAMAEADYAVMAGEMAADTAMSLAEAEGAEARVRLLETQIRRLDAVLRSVEVRLGAGSRGRIADRLTVETRIASMQLMIEEERRMAADALALARSRLGLKDDAALPGYAAPTATEVRPDEAPVLRLAAARSEEASAMGKMARASINPMTAVGLRFERQESRMGGDANAIGLAFMSEIPWRSRGYANAEVRAADAERAAAQTDGQAARYRIHAAITRVERSEKLAQTARRLSGDTLRRLTTEYDAAIGAAGVGGGMGESTVFQTVELLEKATDTELQVIRADTAVRTARAELWRYVPASHFPTPTR